MAAAVAAATRSVLASAGLGSNTGEDSELDKRVAMIRKSLAVHKSLSQALGHHRHFMGDAVAEVRGCGLLAAWRCG